MKPNCPFCQGKNLKTISRPSGRVIFQCFECDLVSAASEIHNGQLSTKVLAKMKTKKHQKRENDWYGLYQLEKSHLLARFEKRLTEIEKKIKPGKILDIGCALGYFLQLAQKRGWEAFGVDISPEAIKYCQKNFDQDQVFFGNLKEVNFKSKFFDAIVIFETLEHMVDLHSFLVETKRILKPNGLLAITVPNQAGLVSKLLGKNWFDYKRPTHFYFFSPITLETILEQTGFKPIYKKTENFYRCSTKSSLIKLRGYYPHPMVNHTSLLMEKLVSLFGIKNIIIFLEQIYVIAQKI